METLGERFARSLATKDSEATGRVGDRRRVGYTYAAHNHDGNFVVEQQAYHEVTDGRISWLRALCSGWQPRAGS